LFNYSYNTQKGYFIFYFEFVVVNDKTSELYHFFLKKLNFLWGLPLKRIKTSF